MFDKGWKVLTTDGGVVHTLPQVDVIDHKHNFTCICSPEVEAYPQAYGVKWYVTHNSFDEYL